MGLRKAIVPAFLLLLGSMVLGATVLREPIARAASPFENVIIGNTASNPVPVHEQGTVNVNLTNGSLSVAPASPATGGGGESFAAPGNTTTLPHAAVASALQLAFENGSSKVGLFYQGAVVAYFFKNSNGDTIEPPLTRPIEFDSISCSGTVGSDCFVEWTGNTP